MEVNELMNNQQFSDWLTKPLFNAADFKTCLKNRAALPNSTTWFARAAKYWGALRQIVKR